MVNENFSILTYGGTLNYYIFELANFSIFGVFLLLIYRLNYININSLIVWLGIFFAPLLFNYLIFSPYLFPDQFIYSSSAISTKLEGTSWTEIMFGSDKFAIDLENFSPINTVSFSTKILSLIPLPNYMTVTSLAFTNKAILLITFLWLKRFFEDENEILVYFLIPSIIVYSSLAIRDTLIIAISIFFIINLIRGRWAWSLLFLLPLFILKVQMFAILLVYFLATVIFQAHRTRYLFFFFIIVFVIFGLVFENPILEVLNRFRLAFIAEDFVGFDGSRSYAGWNLYGDGEDSVLKLNSIFEAMFLGIQNLPILMLIPLPWNWSNIFYPIQTLESIFLIYLFFYLSKKQKIYLDNQYLLLVFILIMGLSIYSLLLANEGTFVRYRFSMFYPFLIGLLYLTSQGYERNKKDFRIDS
jgi:hypothetical protein